MSKRKANYKAKHFGGAGAGQSNVTTGWRWGKRAQTLEKDALPKRRTSDLDRAVERFVLAIIVVVVLFAIFK